MLLVQSGKCRGYGSSAPARAMGRLQVRQQRMSRRVGQDLTAARQSLRQIMTRRQEAVLILDGLLD